LLTQYSQLLISVGDIKIMKLLTDISYEIGCGELKQLSNRHNATPLEKDYFDVIRAKTSLLFAASASVGAVLHKAEDAIQKTMFDFGLHLGNAFQLIDDALDYCSDAKTIGKNIGDDLADGKATLPLLHVLKHGTKTQQQIIKISLEQGTLDYLPDILDAIASTKAIDYTRKIAEKEVESAIHVLHKIPDSPYKEGLIQLAHYAISRDH